MIISDAVSDLAKTTLYSERDYEVALAIAQALQAYLHLPALGDRQLSRWAGAGPPPEPDPAWTVSR